MLIAVVGCSHTSQLERVRDLETSAATAPDGWAGATVTIDPFEDHRPAEAWEARYNRVRYEHPEHAHAFSEDDVVRVGDLEEEYPALLARALPTGAQVSLGTAGVSEFVVRGRLLQSTLTSKARPILAVPSLVGIPVVRHKIKFRVAVELYRAGSPDPIWSETYAYSDAKLEGLYYGTGANRTIARAALRDSVQRAANDISKVVAAQRVSGGGTTTTTTTTTTAATGGASVEWRGEPLPRAATST